MMSIKTILAAASGGTASNGAIELACRFARRFDAHIEGFHAKANPADLLAYAGDVYPRALALTESWWEQFWQKINQYGVPEIRKH
jgi:hypothetical protein